MDQRGGARVRQFTKDGKFVQLLGGGRGEEPGQFQVPHSLVADGAGHLYVVDSLNHRIQKFAASL